MKKIHLGVIAFLVFALLTPSHIIAQESMGNEDTQHEENNEINITNSIGDLESEDTIQTTVLIGDEEVDLLDKGNGSDISEDTSLFEKEKSTQTGDVSIYPSYTLSSNKQTLRPNLEDEFSVHVQDLDFKLAKGETARYFDLEIWTEYYFDSMALQSIELPYISAKDANGEDLNVDVYFMTLTGGSLWVADPVRISKENPGHTVYRSEIESFIEEHSWLPHYEDGSWPIKMYMLIQTVPQDLTIPVEDVNWENVEASEMTFHGDVIYNYKTNGNVPYYESYYDVFTLLSDFTTNPGSVSRSSEVDHYLYYETSNIEVTSDKVTDLVPGETVNLTFTVTNFGNIDNALTASLDVTGLELVQDASNDIIDLSLWTQTETGFELPMKKLDGTWNELAGQTSFTFTQKFKITEDFTGDLIELVPGLSATSLTHEKEDNDSVSLMMEEIVPEVTTFRLNYSGNGHTSGTVITDTTEYAEGSYAVVGTIGDMVKDNHTFIGWQDLKNPEVLIQAGDTILMDRDYYLLAQWKAVEEPTEPMEPTEPTEPIEPTEPTEPTEPVEPSTPIDPGNPTDPIHPQVPIQPEQPSLPATGIRDTMSIAYRLIAFGTLIVMASTRFNKKKSS